MNKISLLIAGLVFFNIFALSGAQDDGLDDLNCEPGKSKPCGSNIGECKQGERICLAGVDTWGGCSGGQGPVAEVCDDGLDNDCNGEVDDCSYDFPIPGWVLIMIGVLMFVGAWVYEKMVVVKKEQLNQEESDV